MLNTNRSFVKYGLLFVTVLFLNARVFAAPDFKITTQVMNSSSGKQVSKFSFNGNVGNLFKQQKAFVYKVLNNIGVSPSKLPKNVRRQINKLHTTNMKAFVAFSRGIELRDQGKFKQARLAFKYARTVDPGFKAANILERKTPNVNKNIQQIRRDAMSRAKTQVRQLLTAPAKKLVTTQTNAAKIINEVNNNVNKEVKEVVEDTVSEVSGDTTVVTETVTTAVGDVVTSTTTATGEVVTTTTTGTDGLVPSVDDLSNVSSEVITVEEIQNNSSGTGASSGAEVDVDVIVAEANNSVDLMVAVQENPEQVKQLMNESMENSNLKAGNALESALFALDTTSENNDSGNESSGNESGSGTEVVKELFDSALSNGMTEKEVTKVVKVLESSGVCQ